MPSPLSNPADRVIVALDFPSAPAALAFTDRLEGRCRWVKVGLELYLAAGPSIIQVLRDRGLEVFLDLKLHDIPNTVAGAVTSLSRSGASLLTVHALGGPAMLAEAQKAAASFPTGPALLAVTILTSMDSQQLTAIGIPAGPPDAVRKLATLAQAAGVPGMVCSPQEVALIRSILGPGPMLVVPGIRPTGSDLGDQRRTATPAAAIADGASMLVIGRPVTRSPDPLAAFESILDEVEAATGPVPHESPTYR